MRPFKTIIIPIILTYTILIGCVSNNESNNEEKFKPSIVVVLCDVSQTVDSQRDSTYEYLKRIPFCFQKNSEIYYLPISEDFSQKGFGKPVKLPLLTDADDNEGEKRKVQIQLENIIQQYKNFADKNGEWTCILTSIQNGYKILDNRIKNEINKEDYNYHLVIFSDMKESCLSTPIGKNGIKVEMGESTNIRNENHATLDSAIAILKNFQSKNIDFDNNKIKVSIILTSQPLTGGYGQKINDIWNEIFNKMNYQSPVEITSNFPFSEI